MINPGRIPPSEKRSPERLRHHYQVERELAGRLRRSTREERAALFPAVYTELFARVPDHPRLTRKDSGQSQREHVRAQVRLLAPLLTRQCAFLEIGAGDCALSAALSGRVGKAYALDVYQPVLTGLPPNLVFLLSDGIQIDLPEASVDLAYSYQLMEHIHPADALDQLREVCRVLKPGGVYLCITPNRLAGPHDISGYFERAASGFHLREYSIGELAALLKEAGFSRAWVERRVGSMRFRLPATPLVLCEKALEALPWRAAQWLARTRVFGRLLDVSVAGRKPGLG